MSISDWTRQCLDNQQLRYAHLDVYPEALCYMKLQSIVDPTAEAQPSPESLSVGTSLFLFSTNNSTLIAEATLAGETNENTLLGLRLHKKKAKVLIKREDVRRFGAIAQLKDRKSLKELLDGDDGDAGVVVHWPLRNIQIAVSNPPPFVHEFLTDDVEQETPTPPQSPALEEQEATPPLPVSGEDGVDDDEAENDYFQEEQACHLPACVDDDEAENDQKECHVPCRLFHTKQDVEHAFIRFAKVLSQKHGIFGSFMSRPPDSFFVPNQSDCLCQRSLGQVSYE